MVTTQHSSSHPNSLQENRIFQQVTQLQQMYTADVVWIFTEQKELVVFIQS